MHLKSQALVVREMAEARGCFEPTDDQMNSALIKQTCHIDLCSGDRSVCVGTTHMTTEVFSCLICIL